MEIRTAPHPSTATPWVRALLCAVVAGPLLVLVLLPMGLGLDRHVVTGGPDARGISRGTLLFERVVPVSDLRAGDVITYERPSAAGPSRAVVEQVVSVGPSGVVTRGSAGAVFEPWVGRDDDATVRRVEFRIPVVGWAYLLLTSPQGWGLALVSAAALALLARRPGPRAAEVVRRAPELVLAGGRPGSGDSGSRRGLGHR